jgi:hypothetical protein
MKTYALRRMAAASSSYPFSLPPFSSSNVAMGPNAIAFSGSIEPAKEKI